MSNRNKSLFRGPGVKHYQLVHRSVRDPALNDPSTSERVLAEVKKGKGRTKQDLEELLEKQGEIASIRANEGEAAAHGIYYDDSEYDYMKHLRGVGQNMDAYLVEAPRKNDAKGKGKALSMTLREEEEERKRVDESTTYRDFLEDRFREGGLRPDMDPALREVLEALDDDAYVEDDNRSQVGSESGGDFFGQLIKGADKGGYRDDPFSDEDGDEEDDADIWGDEEDLDGEQRSKTINGIDPNSAYAKEVLKFKKAEGAGDSDDEFEDDEDDEGYEASEGGDTIAALQAASARRVPRKAAFSDRRSTASASAFSMSSSAMFRNDGLRTLDDKFDQIEHMYDDEGSDSEDEDEPEELGPIRQTKFDEAVEEFLDKYEIHGGKMRQMLGNSSTTPAEKLEALRSQFEKLQVLESVKRQEAEEERVRLARKKGDKTLDEELWDMVRDVDDIEHKWDCETILSTYSNLENHPRVLKLQKAVNGSITSSNKKAPAKISLDPRTGFPIVIDPNESSKQSITKDMDDDAASDDSVSTIDAEEMNEHLKRETISRDRNETPAQKKARKAEVKANKSARRAEKKGTKEAFAGERNRQMKYKQSKLRDAADVNKGNVRGIEVMRLS